LVKERRGISAELWPPEKNLAFDIDEVDEIAMQPYISVL